MVPRTLAAGFPQPLREVVPVRRERLPPGEDLAVGAVAPAAPLLLTVLEGPGVLPLRRAFGMNTPPRSGHYHGNVRSLTRRSKICRGTYLCAAAPSRSPSRSRRPARTGPERRQAATRPQGTARPGARAPRARRCPPESISARRSAAGSGSWSTLALRAPTSALISSRAAARSWPSSARTARLGLRAGAVPGDLRIGHRGQAAPRPRPGPAARPRPGRPARPSTVPTRPGRSRASRAAPPKRRPPRRR